MPALFVTPFASRLVGHAQVNDVLPVPMSLNMARIHRDSEALTVRRNDLVARYAAPVWCRFPLCAAGFTWT